MAAFTLPIRTSSTGLLVDFCFAIKSSSLKKGLVVPFARRLTDKRTLGGAGRRGAAERGSDGPTAKATVNDTRIAGRAAAMQLSDRRGVSVAQERPERNGE